MYVQKNLPASLESEETAVDAQLKDCIHQYRTLGLSFLDIQKRAVGIIQKMTADAAAAAQERMEYTRED